MTNEVEYVDPRAPRLGQALTALLATLGVASTDLLPIAVLALVLATAAVSRWRVDAWVTLWRRLAVPVVGPARDREPAAPHRFAKLVGATFTTAAVPLVLVGGPLAVVGYALTAAVAALAALGAITGFCLGCRLYQQVGYLRRAGLV
jgi:hypothetical protein